MYKYGPGDPEFLDEDQPRGASIPDAFESFWRKVAILDTIVVAGAVVFLLFLGRASWINLGFALGAAGLGLLGLALLLAGWSPIGHFGMYSGPGGFLGGPGYLGGSGYLGDRGHDWDPMRRPDPMAKKIALLFIASGFTLVVPGVALLVLL
jgi:hypothetical protein